MLFLVFSIVPLELNTACTCLAYLQLILFQVLRRDPPNNFYLFLAVGEDMRQAGIVMNLPRIPHPYGLAANSCYHYGMEGRRIGPS
jgi:hypothetical protein